MEELLKNSIESFEKQTLHKGKKYAKENRVTIISTDKDFIQAKVQGTEPEPYLVRLSSDSNRFIGLCSCPVAGNCKHMAATILTVLSEITEKNQSQKSPQIAEVPPPVTLDYSEREWIQKLENNSSTINTKPAQEGILYFLSPNPYYSNNPRDIRIHLFIGKLKKSGEISSNNGKPFQLTSSTLQNSEKIIKAANPEDKHIFAQILQLEFLQQGSKASLIRDIIETKRCIWECNGTRSKFLSWDVEKPGEISWASKNDKFLIELLTDNPKDLCFYVDKQALYINPETGSCGIITHKQDIQTIEKLLSSPLFSAQHLDWIQNTISKKIKNASIPEKKTIQINVKEPQVCLRISLQDNTWNTGKRAHLSLEFLYDKVKLKESYYPAENFTKVVNNVIYSGKRNIKIERSVSLNISEMGWISVDSGYTHPYAANNTEPFIDMLLEWEKKGYQVDIADSFPIKGIQRFNDDVYVDIESQETDWFDLKIGHIIDGKKVDLLPFIKKFLKTYSENSSLIENIPEKELTKSLIITLDDGQTLLMPAKKLIAIIKPFLGILNPDSKEEKLKFSKYHGSSISELKQALNSKKLKWQVPETYNQMIQQLKNFEKIEIVQQPPSLQTTLRHYQIQGLSWLQFLRKFDLAGILADDMGLGKTVQTLAHILLEKHEGRMQEPALVVAPKTLMNNWAMEAEKFAPSLKVLILQGGQRKQHFENLKNYDIILTTYQLLSKDQEQLLKNKYHLLILDEAQNIKNSKTLAHQVLQSIQANHRLCLTGTPIENHLGELWSLFTIIMPGFLGTEKQFQQLFRKPIEKENSLERKKILQKRTGPFLLRRTKQEVVQELPPKTEIITKIDLSEKQQQLYEAVRLTMMNKVMSEVQSKGLARSQIVLLDALLKLRQICCDPRLIKTEKNVSAEDSAKLQQLKQLLPNMIENGRKILLFSQFTSVLAYIEELLHDLGIEYVKITGDTEDRKTPVEKFQEGKVSLFLISLKAGGTGLNLTAADTVIHYDPWWNPAAENQATDRAYRIGQTKPVFVYKWITSGSVEEKILTLQEKKRQLADALFDSSNTSKLTLDIKDLESLFAPLS